MAASSVRSRERRGWYKTTSDWPNLDLLSLALYSKFTNRHYAHTLRPLLPCCYTLILVYSSV